MFQDVLQQCVRIKGRKQKQMKEKFSVIQPSPGTRHHINRVTTFFIYVLYFRTDNMFPLHGSTSGIKNKNTLQKIVCV